MALLSLENALSDILLFVKGDNKTLQVFSYKRNRSVSIIPVGNDLFILEENGYIKKTIKFTYSNLRKQLKLIFKREFPRSRKVRLIKLDSTLAGRSDLKKL